jgi:hypothetical protein
MRPSPPTVASPYSPERYPPVPYSPSERNSPVPYAAATGPYAWNGGPIDEPERKPMVTPFRVVIFIALVASASIAGYSLLVARGSQTIALTVAALAVFAISAALLGINLGAGAMGSARDGRVARAVVGALSGGILCLAAAGGGAAAIMLGMLARP